jgi:hypothetical protein
MSIYIVRNERNEEVSAYTNKQQAESLAVDLETATFHQHSIEELVVGDDCQTV